MTCERVGGIESESESERGRRRERERERERMEYRAYSKIKSHHSEAEGVRTTNN